MADFVVPAEEDFAVTGPVTAMFAVVEQPADDVIERPMDNDVIERPGAQH